MRVLWTYQSVEIISIYIGNTNIKLTLELWYALLVLLALPAWYVEQGLCNGVVFVRQSVPAWAHSNKPAASGLLLWARRQEIPIECCTASAQQQRRANVGSATLSVYVGSWTDLFKLIVLLLYNVSMRSATLNLTTFDVFVQIRWICSILLLVKYCTEIF